MLNLPNIATNTPTFVDQLWHKNLGRPYKLHVNDHGGNGPVIIFLHGLASSSSNWDNLVPLLTPNYHCISLDLIGFGESPKPQWYTYSIEDHVCNISAAIRRLQLRSKYILLGHSLGSLLAARLALSEATRLRRLILLSPPVYGALSMIDKRSARQRTSMYLKAYRFVRTHKRITPQNIIRLSRILPPVKFLIVSQDSWIPVVRSLEQCIENQTFLQDIQKVSLPIDIFYGVFDEVIVPYNVKQLTKLADVKLHPLRVDHIVGKRYAAAVASLLIPNK